MQLKAGRVSRLKARVPKVASPIRGVTRVLHVVQVFREAVNMGTVFFEEKLEIHKVIRNFL